MDNDLSVGKRALRSVKAEWLFQFICWSLIWIGISALVIYAVETGRIHRIDTDSSTPVFDSWWWSFIFIGLLYLPCIPIFLRLLFKKFSFVPEFEVTETTIIWSDGSKTKSDDSFQVGIINILLFFFRMLLDLIIAFFIAPLNMFIILPIKAKKIRDEFDVKGGHLVLGNILFVLIILGSMVAMIGFMIVKWAPEAIQEAQNSASSAL